MFKISVSRQIIIAVFTRTHKIHSVFPTKDVTQKRRNSPVWFPTENGSRGKCLLNLIIIYFLKGIGV